MPKRQQNAERKRRRQLKQQQDEANRSRLAESGPYLKAGLKDVGCDLPFYDGIDSYESEYADIVQWASKVFAILLPVVEVDAAELNAGHDLLGLVPEGYTLIEFRHSGEFTDYAEDDGLGKQTFGSVTFCESTSGEVKAILRLRRDPLLVKGKETENLQFKIASLCHELGHIDDATRKGSLDPAARRFDVVEAEAYAHCYALELMATRHLRIPYEILYHAATAEAEDAGYRGDIARLVKKRHPKRQLTDWQVRINDVMELWALRVEGL